MRIAILTSLVLLACGDNNGIPVDASHDGHVVDAAIDAPYNPATLFDTGLCVDRACTQISPDVYGYTPQFALWADTASKRRWIYLPPGTTIDTSDMDHWQFPVGTKIWKEFTRDNVRVETRFITRIGSGTAPLDWFYVAYQWNDTQTDTTEVPQGVQDANGTMHDIPARIVCKACHENFKPTRILGFGAIQLDVPATNPGDLTLAQLVADHRLTVDPPAPATPGAPYFPIEGPATTKAALGYIHANCSHCHNANSGVHDIVPMELRLLVGEVHDHTLTAPYRTAVGKPATQPVGLMAAQYHCQDAGNHPAECIFAPGLPADSTAMVRFHAPPATSLHMPQAGTEMLDPTGDATLTAWITNP